MLTEGRLHPPGRAAVNLGLAPTTPPAQFSFEVSRAKGTVVVTTHGPLDRDGCRVLGAALRDLVDDQGNLAVAVDLADLGAADPSAVSVLATVAASSARRGGELTLADPSTAMTQALTLAGLAGTIRVTGRRPPPGMAQHPAGSERA